ncbi:hypothetical protein Barb7_00938 [Bacteroidales bacterium Barb7]|nr:hypothetical protein Barb7_00938 [Bacteroidales bacterium Barb7]
MVNNQRNKETQFGNLYGNRLNIHSKNTVFYQVKFSTIVGSIIFKNIADFSKSLVTLFFVANRICLFCFSNGFLFLNFAPLRIIGVKCLQYLHHFMQDTHRECTGTASRIKNFTTIYGFYQTFGFALVERIWLFRVR